MIINIYIIIGIIYYALTMFNLYVQPDRSEVRETLNSVWWGNAFMALFTLLCYTIWPVFLAIDIYSMIKNSEESRA